MFRAMQASFLVVLAFLSCPALLRAAPAPLHQFDFNGDLADAQGGADILSEGGVVGNSTYRFDPQPRPGDYNVGLTLANPGLTDPSVYSIEMRVKFDALRNVTPDSQPWVKLIDFKNQEFDDGYYIEDAGGFAGTGESSFLEFFGEEFAVTESPVVLPDSWIHLVFTRDKDGNVAAYADGAPALSFVDSVGELAFMADENIMRFLQDDEVSPNYGPPGGPVYEATPGDLDYLRIYDVALSAAEVAGLQNVLGDTDADGDVDLDDLNSVRNNFGGVGAGDTNEDGVVDLDDLNNVRNHFGSSAGGANAPEPSTIALAISGLVMLGVARRRGRGVSQTA